MRLAVVLACALATPTTATAQEFLARAAALQPQQRVSSTARETGGFVALFAGLGLGVAAFDYSREVPVAADSPETRKEWVTTLKRPALLYVGLGALTSGLLMTTVWKSSADRVAVGPGSVTVKW